MPSRSITPVVLLGSLVLCACGGDKPVPQSPADTDVDSQASSASGIQMQAEFGALSESEVRATFDKIFNGPMRSCQKAGGEFVSGGLTVKLRIDHSGRVKWAIPKASNLGDHAVESCMLKVVRETSWPIPVGGEDGMIEQELPFADEADRPPLEWESDRLAPTLTKAREGLVQCRGGHEGTFVATVLVNKDGTVRSVGISMPDETAEAAAVCMVKNIKMLHFASPGSWYAKASFEVP